MLWRPPFKFWNKRSANIQNRSSNQRFRKTTWDERPRKYLKKDPPGDIYSVILDPVFQMETALYTMMMQCQPVRSLREATCLETKEGGSGKIGGKVAPRRALPAAVFPLTGHRVVLTPPTAARQIRPF